MDRHLPAMLGRSLLRWAQACVLVVALGAPALAQQPSATPTDDELIHQALHACASLTTARRAALDRGLLQRLLDLERAHGVPESYRGLTLAKACIESGFAPGVRGDCGGGHCKAVGMVQLWPWTERFGVDRTDPEASVRFLLQRTAVGMEGNRLQRLCGRRAGSSLDAFRLAWLRINRGPLRFGRQRCDGMPKDMARLKIWHSNVARWRAAVLPTTAPGAASVTATLTASVAGGATPGGSAEVAPPHPAATMSAATSGLASRLVPPNAALVSPQR